MDSFEPITKGIFEIVMRCKMCRYVYVQSAEDTFKEKEEKKKHSCYKYMYNKDNFIQHWGRDTGYGSI